MESDDELSESEEEMLIYVEFEGMVDNNVFNNEELQLDMIGIDTEHPIMQVNGQFYEGIYEDAMGTYMFFEKDDDPHVDDVIFDKIPTLKYLTKTRKVLKMQRVFAKPRDEFLDSGNDGFTPNSDILSEAGIPLILQKEAIQFLKKLRDDKSKELKIYLEKQKIREEKKSEGILIDSESDEDTSFITCENKELENT